MKRAAKFGSIFVSACIALGCPSISSVLHAGSNPQLIEAAKSEGVVSYYTTMTLSQSKKVVDKFQQKYPFIKAELFRSGGDAILNRIENEARGGLNAWDVVSTRGDQVLPLRNSKLITPYRSPETKFISQDLVDDEGYWTAYYVNPFALGFNTNMVKRDEVPKTYEQLARPEMERKKDFHRRFRVRVSRRAHARLGKGEGGCLFQKTRSARTGRHARQHQSRPAHDGG